MDEHGEGQTPKFNVGPNLPDIGEHSKIAEAAKRKYVSVGSMLTGGGFPKEELDEIYIWWDGYKRKTEGELQRLKTVISSEALPDLERKQLKNELKDVREIVDPINSGIIELTQRDKVGGDDMSPILEQIKEAEDDIAWLSQTVALGEAIAETQSENLDERQIRIRIAQGAWDELLNAFAYEKLNYAADTGREMTTVDDLEEQKAELIASLKKHPWVVRQTEKNRKIYLGLRKRIRAMEDQEIADNLKIVWDSARGSIPQGKSALDILEANELALIGLREAGAFEWDPEELEEEGEGEEED